MYIGKIGSGRSYKKVIFIFIALAVIVVLAVVFFSFSEADITIKPKIAEIAATFDAQIDQNRSFSPENLAKIPGRLLKSEKSGDKNITDVSAKEVDQKASGKITVANDYSKVQVLVAQTRFQAENGQIFRTQERLSVPANSKVEGVTVVADTPGKDGNIEPGRLSVPGLSSFMQKYVYGTAAEKFTGGTREVQIVTQNDLDTAYNTLIEELKREALDDIRSQLAENEQLIETAVQINTKSKEASVKADTETDKFSIKVDIEVIAVVFNQESLRARASSELRAVLPPGKEIYQENLDDMEYEVTDVDFAAGTATLKTTVTGLAALKLSSDIFEKDKLVGRNAQEVKDYFNQYEDIEDIKVSFSPFWVTSVPSLKDHIIINIDRGEQEE